MLLSNSIAVAEHVLNINRNLYTNFNCKSQQYDLKVTNKKLTARVNNLQFVISSSTIIWDK